MTERCKGTTQKGKPCNAKATTLDGYCFRHDPNGDWESKPYKFDDIKRQEYLDLLKDGYGRYAAATAVGMRYASVQEYIKAHPDFEAERRAAEDEATDAIENALFMAASSGNVTACIFWLQNRRDDRWKDKRTNRVDVYDWRKEAQAAGVDDAALFEELVQKYADAIITSD